jgi:hypothetical protein
VLRWDTDVKPVLDVVYRLLEEQGAHLQLEGKDVAHALGRDEDDMDLRRVFEQLDQAGYIKPTWAGVTLPYMIEPTERGLQHTMGWPVPGQTDVEALLRMLDQRIEAPDTPDEERTRLRRLRDAAGDVGTSVMSSLLSAWLSQVTGMGGGGSGSS